MLLPSAHGDITPSSDISALRTHKGNELLFAAAQSNGNISPELRRCNYLTSVGLGGIPAVHSSVCNG